MAGEVGGLRSEFFSGVVVRESGASPLGGVGVERPAPHLFEVGVGVIVGGSAGAEEGEIGGSGDLVPSTGGNENGVADFDRAGVAVEFHGAGAGKEEVNFFGEFVVMAVGGFTGWEEGFGEALIGDRGVGAVEDAADGGAVFGGEGFLAG